MSCRELTDDEIRADVRAFVDRAWLWIYRMCFAACALRGFTWVYGTVAEWFR